MHWTSFVSTTNDWRCKIFYCADFNIYTQVDKSVLHICFESHWIIEYMSITCFVILLVIGVLKCFVTLTLTYTAQVDESVLHICFDSHYINEYMRWTCIEYTTCDSRSKMLCYVDFNIYRTCRKYVTYLFWISLDYWVYALNLLYKYC